MSSKSWRHGHDNFDYYCANYVDKYFNDETSCDVDYNRFEYINIHNTADKYKHINDTYNEHKYFEFDDSYDQFKQFDFIVIDKLKFIKYFLEQFEYNARKLRRCRWRWLRKIRSI